MPIKTDSLKQYVSLRQSLLAEKKTLEARLQSINSALNGAFKTTALKAAPAAAAVPVIKKRKTMSAAGRAKIVAAQKARWAKIHAAKAKK
jgi:hypothetical protein